MPTILKHKAFSFLRKGLFVAVMCVAATVALCVQSPDAASAKENQVKSEPRRRAADALSLAAPSRRIIAEIPYAAHQMLWMDDDNLLLAGARVLGTRDADGRPRSGPYAVYRWNIHSGNVAEFMRTKGGVGILCYDRGNIHVAYLTEDERVIREGPIGQEREIVHKRSEKPPFTGAFNPYDCRYREPPTATQSAFKVITVLRQDHGFIEARYSTFFLVRPSKQRILLENFHGGLGGPRFSEFLKAYVFQDGSGDLSSSADRRVWVIGIDGSVAHYPMPKGQWLGGGTRGMPVRGGLAMFSLSVLAKAEGVYLARDGQVELLVKGYVGGFAISPQGCSVAVSLSPFETGREPMHTKSVVLDVCKGGQ